MLLLVSGVRLENNPIKLLQEMALYDNTYCLVARIYNVCVCECVYTAESQGKHFKGIEDNVMEHKVFLVRSIWIMHIKTK